MQLFGHGAADRQAILWRRLLFAGLLLVTLWLYFPPYKESFVGDDFAQQWRIRELVQQPGRALEVFSPTWTDWYYRPLQNLWLLGNRLLFGLIPAGYYYLQICWHLLAVCLLYQVARRLRAGPGGAFVAAALFAISGQNQLAVDWISSIGNVMSLTFSLLAMLAFLAYMGRPRRGYLLLAVIGLSLLALLGHELSIILPLLLLTLWLTRPDRRPLPPALLAAGLLLAAMTALYIIVQFTRPNANVTAAELVPGSWAAFIRPQGMAAFLFTVFARWSLISEMTGLSGLSSAPALETIVHLAAAVAIIIAAVIGYRRGNRAVRVGLLWAAFSLAFVYAAVWFDDPGQLDTRHLYFALAGLSLAVGAAVQMGVDRAWARSGGRRLPYRRATTAVILSLAVFLLLQGWQTGRSQRGVLAITRRVAAAEADMKRLLPELGQETQVYAYRFTLSPAYFLPVASVWYDRPDLQGGPLELLLAKPVIPADDYLFDHGDDGFYNLMPELQRSRETYLLWSRPPVEARWQEGGDAGPLAAEDYRIGLVAGPAADRRLAIEVAAGEGRWTSLAFAAQVPERSGVFLRTASLGGPGDSFRVRLVDASGAEQITAERTILPGQEGAWQEVTIPVADYAGQAVTIFLEHRCAAGCRANAAYWANPRITID